MVAEAEWLSSMTGFSEELSALFGIWFRGGQPINGLCIKGQGGVSSDTCTRLSLESLRK